MARLRAENREPAEKSRPADDATTHTSRDRTTPSKGTPAGEKSRTGRKIERDRRRRGARFPRPGTLIAVEQKPSGSCSETKNQTNESKARRHAAQGKRWKNGSAEPLCVEEKHNGGSGFSERGRHSDCAPAGESCRREKRNSRHVGAHRDLRHGSGAASERKIKTRRRSGLSERSRPRTARLRTEAVGTQKKRRQRRTQQRREHDNDTQTTRVAAHDSEEEKKTQNPSATPRKENRRRAGP
jgi:hypothetical protein